MPARMGPSAIRLLGGKGREGLWEAGTASKEAEIEKHTFS